MSNISSPNPFRKNPRFMLGMILTCVEGLLSSTVSFAVFVLVAWILEGVISYEKIKMLTGLIIACFALRFLLFGIGYTQGQIGGAQVSKQLRLALGDKFKRIPLKKFTSGKVGTYINIMNDNVAKYERILTHKIPNIVKNVTIIVMILVLSFYIYMPAGIAMLIATLLFLPELKLTFYVSEKYGSERNRVYNNTVSSVVEYINGIQTLRSYGMTGEKNKALNEDLKAFSHISYSYEAHGIPVSVGFNTLQWLSLPCVMLLSAKPWLNGNISATEFLILIMVPILICRLLMAVAVDIFSFKDMYLSKDAISRVFEEEEEMEAKGNFAPENYRIQFENVSFAYEEGREILSNLSATLEEGKLTAIIGDSGSGKSTIMNLLAKYYEADKGQIRIGNKDLSAFASEDVLSCISLVDQDVFLFDDTVRENIRHARRNASEEEIVRACELANCQEFIDRLPEKMDTPIGENGGFLSGGERQRLSIARAILRDSPIILLDEATASLDIENELLVKKAISNLLKAGKTVIMIAHTPTIVKEADCVLKLENKKLVRI